MRIGLDVGYNAVKGVASTNGGGEVRRFRFPTAVGTPEVARFGLGDDELREGGLVEVDGQHWLYGQPAVDLSRFEQRPEDRHWYRSDAYRVLLLAALAEASSGTSVRADVVTGLPLKYYGDREELRERFLGEHVVKRGDGSVQRFEVTSCRVVPQPFGTFLAEGLRDDGLLANNGWMEERRGVIDVGGHTTNILSVYGLAEVRRESASVNVGGWQLVRDIREYLVVPAAELDLRDHEIAQAIIRGNVRYGGGTVDLTDVVARHAGQLADQIIGVATQQWNGGMQMVEILVTGGGAYLLGAALTDRWRHARVVEDPVYANAVGYWKLAGRGK